MRESEWKREEEREREKGSERENAYKLPPILQSPALSSLLEATGLASL